MLDLHDPISSSSHLLTAIWALFATGILVRLTQGHGVGRWAVAFYGFSMVLLYLASGLFHGIRHETQFSFRLFQRFDKSAIFVLIAGSFLPLLVYRLKGSWRRWSIIGIFTLAAIGVVSLWLLPDFPHDLLVGIYVGMGSIGMLPSRQFLAAFGSSGTGWVGIVVVSYVGGAIIEVLKAPTIVPGWFGPHEILHLADMAGTMSLFVFVLRYVIVRPPLQSQ